MPNHNKPTSGMTEINGAQLYYEMSGEGQPLLLLHAGIADSRMWDEQVNVFAQSYRVIRLDLRGFGRSNVPAGTFSNHGDARALLDFLQVQEAIVLGISFGGLIALDFTLAYPTYVKTLILGAPSVSGEKPSDRIRQFWADEEAFMENDDLEGATELNLRLWVDGPHRTPEQVGPVVREQVREMQLNIFKIPVPDDIDAEGLTPPAIERLGEIKVPTLVIVGDLDLEEKLTLADRLVSEIPHATKAIIPNAAHMMNMEQPAQFNQIVLDFLASR